MPTPTSRACRLAALTAAAALAACSSPQRRPPDAIGDDPAAPPAPAPAPAPTSGASASAAPAGGLAVARLNAHAADGDFARLVDRAIDGLVAFNPMYGTALGLHTHDGALPDLSRAAFERELARVRADLAAARALSRDALSGLNYHDHTLLVSHLEGRLFDLEELRDWEHDPMLYGNVASEAAHGLIVRDFAPLDVRARALVSRLKALPAVFAAARANLAHPPREFTEMALELGPGTVQLYETAVPKAFSGVTDPALRAEVEAARVAALAEVRAFLDWLKRDLLPRSDGQFALGEERYRRKLLLDELIDTPVDVLLTRGQELLTRTRNEFIEYAQMIDPLRTPREVLLEVVGADHPAAEQLVAETQGMLGELRAFTGDHALVTLPDEVELRVAPMPPFFWGFAAMSAPGPFEQNAREAYFYIDTPKADATAAQRAAHLRRFNRASTRVIASHEAYPGHYVQLLYGRKNPSKLRQVLWSYTFGEGWAHYAEQMLLEEGFHKGDERLALAQRSESLVRICRYLASLKMHTRGMSVADGRKLFTEQCFQDDETARRETLRGTFDPMYLNYTLGKMMIYELREDYRREVGEDRFSLRDFHDQLLRNGSVPMALHREIMMAIAAGRKELPPLGEGAP